VGKWPAGAIAEIRRHAIEDGGDPDAPPDFAPPLLHRAVRAKLGLSQTGFATPLGVPIATVRNRKQNRFAMEPAARALPKIIDREPDAALRARRAA